MTYKTKIICISSSSIISKVAKMYLILLHSVPKMGISGKILTVTMIIKNLIQSQSLLIWIITLFSIINLFSRRRLRKLTCPPTQMPIHIHKDNPYLAVVQEWLQAGLPVPLHSGAGPGGRSRCCRRPLPIPEPYHGAWEATPSRDCRLTLAAPGSH